MSATSLCYSAACNSGAGALVSLPGVWAELPAEPNAANMGRELSAVGAAGSRQADAPDASAKPRTTYGCTITSTKLPPHPRALPQEYIENENARLDREGQFWSKEIVVKIEYKFCPNLTIIDTPGARWAGRGWA